MSGLSPCAWIRVVSEPPEPSPSSRRLGMPSRAASLAAAPVPVVEPLEGLLADDEPPEGLLADDDPPEGLLADDEPPEGLLADDEPPLVVVVDPFADPPPPPPQAVSAAARAKARRS